MRRSKLGDFISERTQRAIRAISPGGRGSRSSNPEPPAGKTQTQHPSPDQGLTGQGITNTQVFVTSAGTSSQNCLQSPANHPAGQNWNLVPSVIRPTLPTISISQSTNSKGQSSSSLQSPRSTHQSFTVDPALKHAIEEYAAQLSDEDKAAFRSAGDIMQELKAIDEADAKASVSRSFGSRVEKILQCIKQFVGAVGIFIQYSPEISSLVVGGLNCVLLLALGYIEFFEKLTTMMDRIAGHLKYLSEYGSLMFRSLPEVQDALKNAYCDLLAFFVEVRGVFVDKEGRASYLKSFKLFLKLTWEPFESKFVSIQDRFFDHTLIVVRSAGVHALIKSLEESRSKDQEQKAHKRRQILLWLSLIDYEATHQRYFQKYFPGTGLWLLENPIFVSWKESLGKSLLWCYGSPGAGKTVLASLVVEKLSQQYELSGDTGISFLYCNFKESYEAGTYIRIAMKQLARRMTELPTELEALYEKHHLNASTPCVAELQNVFMKVSKRFGQVFLVLDALDECTNDQREGLLGFLHYIMSSGGGDQSNVKVLITSRQEQDIRQALTSFPIVEIEARKVKADIKSYVMAKVDQYLQNGALRLRDKSLKDKIITALVNRAGGMFLWVEFQLKHICSQTSDHGIQAALESLPEGMEETYRRIILLINNKPKAERELAKRVLMWIAYAARPLILEELVCLVALEKDTRSKEQLDSMVPQSETIFDVCTNLIVLDDVAGESQPSVRFVHFSVQEFLLGDSLNAHSRPAAIDLNIETGIAHAEMASLCITFLLFCDFFQDGLFLTYSDPVLYAVYAWKDHARALTDIDQDLMELILRLFESRAFLFRYTFHPMTEMRCFIYEIPKGTDFSPFIIALIYDLSVLQEHLREDPQNQKHYTDDICAIHYAARQNSCKAIEALHTRGFRINQHDKNNCLPLYYATGKEVCQLLLDMGADVNAKGGKYGCALQAAASCGNRDVVELLLDRGADVNAEGGEYGYALQAAVYWGKEGVVELLLDRGADLNAKGRKYGYVLQAAAYRDHKDVVELLLDRGADVNAEGGKYGYALQAAAYCGKEGVVELLLDRGAEVNSKGGGYGFAVQAAVDQDEMEVVRLLLARGATMPDTINFSNYKHLTQNLQDTGTTERDHEY